VRGRNRDLARTRRAAGDQLGDDADAPLFGGGHGVHHRRLGHETILDQPLRQAARPDLLAPSAIMALSFIESPVRNDLTPEASVYPTATGINC
jgi:hypothetical protein